MFPKPHGRGTKVAPAWRASRTWKTSGLRVAHTGGNLQEKMLATPRERSALQLETAKQRVLRGWEWGSLHT